MVRNGYYFFISRGGTLQRNPGAEDTGDGENVVIPKCVRKIDDYAFICMPFKSMHIPGSVRIIGIRAFAWCKSLVSVSIPRSVKRIGGNAFLGCASLMEIRFEGTAAEWAAVTKGGDWHKGIPADCVSCTDSTVALPHFVIEDGILVSYLGAAADLQIPDGVTAIGEHAFRRCHIFPRTVIIPEGVRRIGRGAFWGCLRLSRVELPASLEEIGEKSFLLCRSLERIVYHGTQEQWDAVRKGGSWDERVFANVPELVLECVQPAGNGAP